MSKALINGNILRWARERTALLPEELAARAGQKVERITAWEAGNEQPTFKQAQTLAAITHIPFGYLFLKERPDDELPLPDLRTVGSAAIGHLDINARDVIRDVLFKHDWYVEILEEQGAEPLNFVGKYTSDADVKRIAADMRKALNVTNESQKASNWEAYLRILMKRADDVGIWTMRTGIVGNNTRRLLDVKQFRGFAISHPLAPLVFINGQDAKAAQIFTLAHELAHIWIGKSGISNVIIGDAEYGTSKKTEIICNAIAAEFLVPESTFLEHWSDNDSNDKNYNRLSNFFKVSSIVIARRAFDLRKIQEHNYAAFYKKEEDRWKEEANEGGSGGDFYNTLPLRNGVRFSNTVASYAIEGRLLYRDAAALLNTTPPVIQKYYKRATAR